MADQNPDPDYMLLLPYTPREDSDARGYDDWLREVDNPFFNQVPGVVHYTNWRIRNVSPAVPYTHFDFLRIETPESAEQIWGDADLSEFAANWTKTWGRYPDASEADMHLNYHVYLCRRLSGHRPATCLVSYQPCAGEPTGTSDSVEIWKIIEPVIGDARFPYLRVEALQAEPSTQSEGAAVGAIVATPD